LPVGEYELPVSGALTYATRSPTGEVLFPHEGQEQPASRAAHPIDKSTSSFFPVFISHEGDANHAPLQPAFGAVQKIGRAEDECEPFREAASGRALAESLGVCARRLRAPGNEGKGKMRLPGVPSTGKWTFANNDGKWSTKQHSRWILRLLEVKKSRKYLKTNVSVVQRIERRFPKLAFVFYQNYKTIATR